MSLKHLLYSATTCRITSYLCVAVFFYALIADLAPKVQVMALGLGFAAWVCSTWFVEQYKQELAKIVIAQAVAEGNLIDLEGKKEEKEGEEEDPGYPTHPTLRDNDE